MRTDVKVGVALSAVVLIIAVSYYGTKKKPEVVQLADAADKVRDQNAKTLDGLLSSGSNPAVKNDKDKRAADAARQSAPNQRTRPRPANATGTPGTPADQRQTTRQNPARPAGRNPQAATDPSTGLAMANKPSEPQSGPTLEQSSVLPARPAGEPTAAPAQSSTPPASATGSPPAGSNPAADSLVRSNPAAAGTDASPNNPALSNPTREPLGTAQSTPSVVTDAPAPAALSPNSTTGDSTQPLPTLRTPPQNQNQNPTRVQPTALTPTAAGESRPAGGSTGAPARVNPNTSGPSQMNNSPTINGTPTAKPAPIKPETPASAPRTHVVASGDSFAKLAERYYGSQKHVRTLLAANPTIDPKAMRVGSTITIPPLSDGSSHTSEAAGSKPGARSSKSEARPVPGPGQHEYTVAEGDTLYTIAEKHLGSGNRWPEVYELNKEEVGNDPMTLRVGHVILLPAR